MKNIVSKKFKRGGVSLFVVIITCVLVAILTASFIRLMIRDQQQASKQDLSQSAYDSAQAGVEDAKRFLSIYKKSCAGGNDLSKKVVDGKTIDCQAMSDAIKSQSCYTLAAAAIGSANGETKIQTSTSGNDEDLDQAYTCVKIAMQIADFLGQSSFGESSIIPLKGVSEFNQVKISWHSKEDMSNSSSKISLDDLSNPSSKPNLISDWQNKNRPAIMKAQFYGFVANIPNVLAQMDTPYADDGTGSNEMLFYPATGSVSKNIFDIPKDRRTDQSTAKTTNYSFTTCKDELAAGGSVYACEVTVNIGHQVSPSDILYMQLAPLYNSANFKVEILNNGTPVNFDGVQPKVDSTGRTNEQYRRVESRVEFADANFPIPNFASQTEDDSEPLCKDFWVTKISNGGVSCKL